MISASSSSCLTAARGRRTCTLARLRHRRLRPTRRRPPSPCCTAASTSPAVASTTCACGSPVAGFHTGGAPVARPAGDMLAADPVLDGPHRRCPSSFVPEMVCRRPSGADGRRWRRCSALCPSYAVRAACVEPSSETSATGTSHQAGLSGAGTSGSVSTWTTVVRVGWPAPARSAFSNSSMVAGADDVGAEARGVGGQVDRQHVAVEAGVGAVAVAGAEPLRAERLRQRADRREAVVLHEHDDQLDALVDRGDDLLTPSSGTSRRRP